MEPVRGAGPKGGQGLRDLALGALADAGIGGEREASSPGAVSRLAQGTRVFPQEVCAWRKLVSELAVCSASDHRVHLRRVADAGSSLLRRCGGRVEKFVAAVGSQFFSPHVDTGCVSLHFGVVKTFPQIDQLLRALSPGVPVDVAGGGDLEAELAYGNHPSILKHTEKIVAKIASDVVLGRALVFDVKFISEVLGVRVSPLGVVEEPKFRIIHDLTFAAGARVRSSVNGDTDFARAPECLLGHVLFEILSRIIFLRQLHGASLQILLCRIDVKEAFRQVPVDPSGASVFGYTMGDQVVVDLRCQFGWRSSPGFWSLFSSALEHSHTHDVSKCRNFARRGRSRSAC